MVWGRSPGGSGIFSDPGPPETGPGIAGGLFARALAPRVDRSARCSYGCPMSNQLDDNPPEQVTLRDVTPADLPALFRFQSDPEANRMAVVNPRGLDEFNAFWKTVLSDPGVVAKAVVVDGTVVGNISCFQMDGLDSVGYWIDREYWGRGIAKRSLALLLEEVAIRPLHARVAAANIGSIRVLQHCGFECVGTQTSEADDRFPACEESLFELR